MRSSRRAAIVAAVVLALGTLAGAAPAGAETVGGTCGAVTALAGGVDTGDSFSLTTCTGLGVNWSAVRTTAMGVTWTVTTSLATVTCNWPAELAATCNGPRPVPATAGETVSITVSATDCTPCAVGVVWVERPQVP